ncbi:MAG: hypothetical protein ACLFU6_12240 [Candidatus Hydrogenedentota bacterium]
MITTKDIHRCVWAVLAVVMLTGCQTVSFGTGNPRGVEDRPLAERQTVTPAALEAANSHPAPASANPSRDNAIFVYGGKWTDTRFLEILQLDTDFQDSYLGTVGLSRTFLRFGRHLDLEGETNLTRHWGKQDHFEVNAALNLRWNTFPWDRFVDTSLAYGLGPSYAFGRPRIEERRRRPVSRLLVFMVGEITVGPPAQWDSPWEGLIRIHHRSGGFGTVSDAGGSNFVTMGLRYRF